MKKIVLIISALFYLIAPSVLSAKIDKVSPLPLPSAYIIDLNPQKCDEACLYELLKNGYIFSFLARYEDTKNIELQREAREKRVLLNIRSLPLDLVDYNRFKLALLQPKKIIGRYSVTTTNAVIAYLLKSGIEFEIESFDSLYEDRDSLLKTIREIEEQGFEQVIAILTLEGAKNLLEIGTSLDVFIPTVNIRELESFRGNLYFGGIDYRAQLHKLKLLASPKSNFFTDDSQVGRALSNSAREIGFTPLYEESIGELREIEFDKIVKNRTSSLRDSSILFNTPIVKSSLLMSQLSFYNIKPYNLLSTQINFDKEIFTLTQANDRSSLFIANSIIEPNKDLVEYNALLENELRFNWINYSTTIGVEFFLLMNNFNIKRYFKENMIENQLKYDIEILKINRDNFEKSIKY